VSLRNPGSYADVNYPSAVVANRFFKGSGTSQAAAVVSGAAAVIISKFPSATPNQVKAALKQTAQPVPTGSSTCQGSGLIDLGAIRDLNNLPTGLQSHTPATGLGTLDASRGGDYLTNNGITLTGEKDIFAKPFNTAIWAPLAATGSSWSGGTWNGSSWSGSSWSGSSWSGSSWSGSSWSGSSWSGSSWSGSSWSNMTWTGSSWSGSSWSGSSWSGSSWSGSSWSGQRWE
jgi:serine protease AprX